MHFGGPRRVISVPGCGAVDFMVVHHHVMPENGKVVKISCFQNVTTRGDN